MKQDHIMGQDGVYVIFLAVMWTVLSVLMTNMFYQG